jgi:hypothetical protein
MVVHVLEPRDIDLEKFCFRCKGLGLVAPSEPCGHCGGTGRVLTDFGQAILDLIARHVLRETRTEQSQS